MGKVLITGASSGIGKDMAYYLNDLGYELFLVGRSKEKLEEINKDFKKSHVLICDLSNEDEVINLYNQLKKENIDILINNAGFGLFGFFNKTDLDTELKMIKVNIMAVHILTKLFLQDFIKRDSGYILNVASAAGFLSGPYLNTYYATKNYNLKLTMAIYEELRRINSSVKISALCPGPVNTNFNSIAGGSFNTKGLNSTDVARYGIDQMFKNKLIIIPTFKMKLGIFISRFVSTKLMLKITYNIQKKKTK